MPLTRTDIIEAKLDKLLERTTVLEQVALCVAEHETILRGPNKDDGLITEIPLIKERQRKQDEQIAQTSTKLDTMIKNQQMAQADNKKTIIKIAIALGSPLVLSVLAFVWGLINHSVILTMGK